MTSHFVLLTGVCCLGVFASAAAASPSRETGQLAHPDIIEASGLARSIRHENRYWVANDSGNAPVLYAIDSSGERHGVLMPRGIGNTDWEDLASFTLDGEPYLLVADVGDNNGVRSFVRLHAIPEPAELPGAGRMTAVDVAFSINVKYPGGGRDTESVAVADGFVYLLTKRTLPPELYRTALRATEDKVRTLEFSRARRVAAATDGS